MVKQEKNRRKILKTLGLLGLVLTLGGGVLLGSRLQVKAAEPYNVASNNIAIEVNGNGKYKVNGSEVSGTDSIAITCMSGTAPTTTTTTTTTNVVTVTVATGKTAKIVLKDVSIDVSGTNEKAAFCTSGGGNVEIILEGTNVLKSGNSRAGLEKGNTGTLTITANSENDSLAATGGVWGAGIGGGEDKDGTGIIIEGGTVVAIGGATGAGIGGGDGGSGKDITITGGTVTANGGSQAAGIGGGCKGDNGGGNGDNITITGGKVTAVGAVFATGIGGGLLGNGKNIKISGGTVTATGGQCAAGIGGGAVNNAGDNPTKAEGIQISGDAKVTAIGGGISANDTEQDKGAPGIGNGLALSGYVDYERYGVALTIAEVTKNLNVNGWAKTYTPDKDGNQNKIDDKTGTKPVNAGGSGDGTSQSSGSQSDTKEQPKRSEFQRTIDKHANSIKHATSGAKVAITGDEKFNALPNSVMKELLKKKDVSLEFTYIYQGKKYTILIPAGSAEDNDIPWYGPMYLWSKYGVKVE